MKGLVVNSVTGLNDAVASHYNEYDDAREGGSRNTDIFTRIFISMTTLLADWSRYNTADWWDYTKAGFSTVAAIAEVAIGANYCRTRYRSLSDG